MVRLIFFEKAREKLLNHLKDMNEETWKEAYEHDDSVASQVLTNQFVFMCYLMFINISFVF